VSETLDRPAVVPIGAEYWGKARDFRRRVEREDADYIATLNGLLAPIEQRLKRYPGRKLRPEMLTAFVQDWRFMPCRDFRLDLEAQLERTRCALVERRCVAGTMKLDPAWENEEPDIAVIEMAALVDGNRFKMRSKMTCAFSLHAIARRLQRGSDTADAAVLHDMNVVALVDRTKLSGGGFKVVTDEYGGGWRGRVVRVTDNDGKPLPVLSIRTWMTE
jgi:hypothetical protein